MLFLLESAVFSRRTLLLPLKKCNFYTETRIFSSDKRILRSVLNKVHFLDLKKHFAEEKCILQPRDPCIPISHRPVSPGTPSRRRGRAPARARPWTAPRGNRQSGGRPTPRVPGGSAGLPCLPAFFRKFTNF